MPQLAYAKNVIVGLSKDSTGTLIPSVAVNTQITDPTASTYLKEGKIAFVNENNVLITTANAASCNSFKPVYVEDGVLKFGATMTTKDTILSATAAPYVAETFKAVKLGDATTPALSIAVSPTVGDVYTMQVRDFAPMDGDVLRGNKEIIFVTVQTGMTTLDVLHSLYVQLQNDWNFEAGKAPIVLRTYNFKQLCEAPGALIGGAAVTGVKVRMFKTTLIKPRTAVGATDGIGDLAGIAVGQYVNIGAFGTGSVYKILAVTPSSLTLDAPIAEIDGVYSVSVFAPPASGTNLKTWITGAVYISTRLPFTPGFYEPLYADFELTTSSNFNTQVVITTANNKGVGNYKHVSKAEWVAMADQGVLKRVNTETESNIFRKYKTVKDQCYHTYVIEFSSKGVADASGTFVQIKQWVLFIPTEALYYSSTTAGATVANVSPVLQAIVNTVAPNEYTTFIAATPAAPAGMI